MLKTILSGPQFSRQLDRAGHAQRTRFDARRGAEGDVHSGAVVDGRSDNRQSQRDVDARIESERFHGNQPLVVIHADVHVRLHSP